MLFDLFGVGNVGSVGKPLEWRSADLVCFVGFDCG